MFTKLLAAKVSMISAKFNWIASHRKLSGMVVDSTRVQPSASEEEAIIKMPRPTKMEELRAFLGMAGYLRQYIEKYSVNAAPLTKVLRNKELASAR